MARITDYTSGTPASGDEIPYWDASNNVMKKSTKTNLVGSYGDASTNTSSSVDSEIVLFSGTGGKTLKRASTTGILKGTSGVISAASAGTDYYAPGSTDVAIADGGTGASTKAAGFDALSPMTTSGDVIYGGASGTGTRLAKGSNGTVLTLAGGVPTWAAPSAGGATNFFHAGKVSGTQTITSGGWQKVTFDGTIYNVNTNYDTSNNRFVAPNTGYYQFSTGLSASVGDSTSSKNIAYKINGTTYVYLSSWKVDNGAQYGGSMQLALTAADYVEVYVYNNSTALTIYNAADKYTTWFNGCQLA